MDQLYKCLQTCVPHISPGCERKIAVWIIIIFFMHIDFNWLLTRMIFWTREGSMYYQSLYYSDVIMGAIASQITSLAIVYSSVYSDANQRKHQGSASLFFVRGIHRGPWIPRTNDQLRGKCFHLMTSSWSKCANRRATSIRKHFTIIKHTLQSSWTPPK